jgi:hypothetical protein
LSRNDWCYLYAGRLPQTIARVLKDYLRGRQLLLVLDNFEQMAAATPLVGQLRHIGNIWRTWANASLAALNRAK